MNFWKRSLPLFAVMAMLIAGGCAKNYRITHELEAPIDRIAIATIGEIVDMLPEDFDEGKKPTTEQIDAFKSHLTEQLRKKEIFASVAYDEPDAQYVVEGSILQFKKGSGLVRALIGFGIGSAKVTTELRLIRRAKSPEEQDEVIFAGNFKQTVSDWIESGDKIFERVAKDFAKVLKKRMKKIQKQMDSEKES
ncbi:MAG: DUF4410 domain-containing protein [candidate division Zixibacteria bacterium]|nr:DUF4410 domain-containing protein [candidate division Zixibacteria bacterium]